MKRLAYIFALVCACVACDNNKVYDKYVNTSVVGWEKTDAVAFEVAPMAEDALYGFTLNMRTDHGFPFKSVVLIVDTKVVHNDSLAAESMHSDTLTCVLADDNGRFVGDGLNLFQYSFDLPSRRLGAGDSLHMTVRHDMKREMLPGVSDIGLRITK